MLTADELAELADLKAPMVRLRGQWIELDARRLAAGLKLVGRTDQATVGELLGLGLGVALTPKGLPVEGIDADGWLGELLSGQTERRLAPVEAPASFAGQLRPYQARGLAWLDFLHRCGLGGVLADDMGLGKTVQLLALLAHDAGSGPSLLVCPMSLVGNWQREAARFTPQLRVHVHHGKERARGKHFADAVAASDLVVTTYALAARDAADLRKITWRGWWSTRRRRSRTPPPSRPPRSARCRPGTRIAVTGTPVENRLADLWSILEFANPGLLGPAAAFKRRYAEPIERHGDEDAAERLRRFTGPFILRRVKTDKSIIADLPDKLEMDVVCNLTAEQAALYQAVVEDMLRRIEAERRHRAARPGAGDHDQAEAGLQPPRAFPARRQLAGRPFRQARLPRGDPRRGAGGRREGAAVHPVRRVRRHAARPPRRPVRARGAVPARRRPEGRSGTRWWPASRPTTPRARRCSCSR